MVFGWLAFGWRRKSLIVGKLFSRNEKGTKQKPASSGSLLGQQFGTAIADRELGHLRKALQQPGQHHLQADMVVGDVDMAGGGLPKRADTKQHPVVLPALLVDSENGHAGCRARQPAFQPSHRLVAAELVRDGYDERSGHLKTPQNLSRTEIFVAVKIIAAIWSPASSSPP